MRLTVHVLGFELLAVDTGCEHPDDEHPRMEASGGGDFPFGFVPYVGLDSPDVVARAGTR